MGKRKISETEQEKLCNKVKAELERLEKTLEDTETKELLDDFKNKFNLCETSYKIILIKYLKSNNSKDLKINMKQVPSVLDFAGYSFDQTLLNEIFGSSSKKKGKYKTVKKLRDAVTHGISGKALSEITERKDELFGYMDEFLSKIKSFDEIPA